MHIRNLVSVLLGAMASQWVNADNVNSSAIKTFEANKPAIAAEVNGNFSELARAIATKQDNIAGSYTKVLRVRSKGLASTVGTAEVSLNGTVVQTTTRSYGLVVIDRATGNVEFNVSYDIFADNPLATGTILAGDTLATKLATMDSSKIIVINTNDEPQANRLNEKLVAQLMRCGASGMYRGPAFRFRSAYALVGICGMGTGSGLEFYAGNLDSDTSAFIDESIIITDGGFSAPYKTQPRVIRSGNSRTACQRTTAVTDRIVEQTFTLYRSTQVSVNAKAIRFVSGRADLQLYLTSKNLNGTAQVTDLALDHSLTYTPSVQWEQGQISWVGTLLPGTHTLYLRGDQIDWGCGGDTYDAINTTLFE